MKKILWLTIISMWICTLIYEILEFITLGNNYRPSGLLGATIFITGLTVGVVVFFIRKDNDDENGYVA